MLTGLRSRGWQGLAVLYILLALTWMGLLPAVQIAAQTADDQFHDELVMLEEHPIAPAPAGQVVSAAAPAATNQIYLPLLRGAPQANIQLAAQIDANQNPVNPSNSFAYGITDIFAVMHVQNAAGKPWTVEWYRNGLRIPGTTSRGTFAADTGSAKLVRRFAYANRGRLPASTYKVVLYVDGKRMFEAEAVVTR